jgi:uncharacterized membrane protein YgcG
MRNYFPLVAILCLLTIPTAMRAEEQNRNSNFNLSCGLLGKFVRYKQHYQHCKAVVICNDRGVCRRKPTKPGAPVVALENPETNAISDADPSLTAGAGVTAGASIAGASANAGATAGASAGPGGANASGSAEGGASAGGGSVGGGIGGGLGVGGL